MEALDIRRRDYQRPRDARVALIRCGECKEYYETSVRQARRIQKGETRRLCQTCRTIEAAQPCMPDRTAEYTDWWLSGEPLDREGPGLTRAEAIALAKIVHPGEAHRAPVVSPSWRLQGEEANRTSTTGGGAVRISGLGYAVNVTTAV